MFKHKMMTVRRELPGAWVSENPILKFNELAVEILPDNRFNIKKGNGHTPWVSLEYFYVNLNLEDTNEIIDDFLVNIGTRKPVEDFFVMYGDGDGLKSGKVPDEDDDVVRLSDVSTIVDATDTPIANRVVKYSENSGLKSDKIPDENNDVVRLTDLSNANDISTAIPTAKKLVKYNDDAGLKSGKVPDEDNDVIRKAELDAHKSDTEAHSATSTPTASRIAFYNENAGLKSSKVPVENDDVIRLLDFTNEVANINSKISTLNGAYYVLDAYNFGKILNETDPDDIILLNTYAIANTPNASSMADVYNDTVIINEFDTSEFVYNKISELWVKYPNGYLTIATNDHLGVVKGTADPGDGSKDGAVSVNLHGEQEVIGFNDLKYRVGVAEGDINGKLDIQQAADDEGKAMVIGPDGKLAPGVSGKVDSVDGVEPGGDKNVKLTHIYVSAEDFEADKANIPAGARVVKLYESPEVYSGFEVVPDYDNQENINRFTVNGNLQSWVADRTGFVFIGGVASSTGTSIDFIITVNSMAAVQLSRNKDTTDTKAFQFKQVVQVVKGQTVELKVYNGSGATSGVTVGYACCFYIPPKAVALPPKNIIVEPGGDLSLDEKPVLINDNGVIRQKLDYDGSPIWVRTLDITIPDSSKCSVGAQAKYISIEDSSVKISRIISVSGDWSIDSSAGNRFSIGSSLFWSATGKVTQVEVIRTADNNLRATLFCQDIAYTWNSGDIKLTVEYTKV
jgi:hypothetical protein